ncbi:Zn(2)-C6 fungal-type domain-containing protein [Favolaschia claudopus]|uniref:Zn(2)-C6 fungal-type domain-containing protein n=1 Tax=Favolaschia claudopus TaxID=2862362 RepID=A0AAV9ZD04_9AGAR
MAGLWVGVSTLWVSTFLYGMYLILFIRCLSIFYHGKPQTPLLVTAIIMFLLSTTIVIIFLLLGASLYGTLGLDVENLQTAEVVVYVTNNIVADGLLIYRCYVIWNTIYIIIAPVILLIATMIFGYMVQLKLFFILSLTVNLFVPTLVAARLWWVTRRLRGPGGAATRRKGRNAMIIILESGLIYSAVVSIHMAFFHYNDPRDQVVFAALGQIVGIVPTLIIVRVGLGVSAGDSPSSASATYAASNSTLVAQPSMHLSKTSSSNIVEIRSPRFPVHFATEEAQDGREREKSWGSATMV